MATSPVVDEFDESMKKQISYLWRVMSSVKSFKEDNTPCKIDEGLYLGSIGAAANKIALKSLNVTHILTVARRLPPMNPGDFVYKVINVADKDDVDLKQYFNQCFDFIEDAKMHGGAVLVHCLAGKSRSLPRSSKGIIGLSRSQLSVPSTTHIDKPTSPQVFSLPSSNENRFGNIFIGAWGYPQVESKFLQTTPLVELFHKVFPLANTSLM
ncbi:hypothetical protein PIB30_038359 [Stylosanthes scabra]|uniref:protein-tyrosine-phosphatase n=1 Tax=Stylosanthes scabra TaxID=79078 RepID=A0ABU6ZAZ4_9FABA|nr:hypothetical protein [Stylosanthes scabra]